jgi:hypothetical protein
MKETCAPKQFYSWRKAILQTLPRRVILAVLMMASLGVAACDDGPGNNEGAASIGVNVQALDAADVVAVRVTVTGDGIDPPIVSELDNVDGQWQGLIDGIPAGERTFAAEAVDEDGVVCYSGSTDAVAVVSGETVNVQIFLQQASSPEEFENSMPRFTALVISNTRVGPNETVSLRVEAMDPDPEDTLTFSWHADRGEFDDTAASAVTWMAPEMTGEYQLTASVTDSKGAMASLSTTITVASGSGGSASVSLSLNTWPEVSGLFSTPARIDANETATLYLSASDPDGDPLTFDWTADCDGDFDDPTVENPTFLLNSLPEGGADCALTVEITDGRGGRNQARLSIATGPGIVGGDDTPISGALYRTGFEAGDPVFVIISSSGDISNTPPAGTAPRTGSAVLTLSSITSSYQGRDIESEDCIALKNDQDVVTISAFATASSENGGNQISARLGVLWFTDSACSLPHSDENSSGQSAVLPEGSYESLTLDAPPPSGATHVKLRIQVRDDNGGDNTEDDWACDDILVMQ